MRDIHLQRKEYDDKDFRKRLAAESDCALEIREPARIFFDGQLGAVLLYDQQAPEAARESILGLKDWVTGVRGSGIQTDTVTIGYQPRVPARSKEQCMCATIGYTSPDAHRNVLELARIGSKIYETQCPEIYARHRHWLQTNVREEWRVPDSVFTSGVINRNCSMAYHKDRGNIRDGWSVMWVLKHNMSGANLNIIDFDTKLFLPDRSVLIFNGQQYMHGVTPMQKTKPDGYRYSIVFYALEAMKQCLAPDEELRRAQKMRTEREMRRAGLIE